MEAAGPVGQRATGEIGSQVSAIQGATAEAFTASTRQLDAEVTIFLEGR
ncbi:MAG: hypothetical protein K2X49_14665 [Acetobacteraceae bacterium]|nr:hypothetical protein [Acetobacteraceae bacterium]